MVNFKEHELFEGLKSDVSKLSSDLQPPLNASAGRSIQIAAHIDKGLYAAMGAVVARNFYESLIQNELSKIASAMGNPALRTTYAGFMSEYGSINQAAKSSLDKKNEGSEQLDELLSEKLKGIFNFFKIQDGEFTDDSFSEFINQYKAFSEGNGDNPFLEIKEEVTEYFDGIFEKYEINFMIAAKSSAYSFHEYLKKVKGMGEFSIHIDTMIEKQFMDYLESEYGTGQDAIGVFQDKILEYLDGHLTTLSDAMEAVIILNDETQGAIDEDTVSFESLPHPDADDLASDFADSTETTSE